jgi:MoxR-like ATPase
MPGDVTGSLVYDARSAAFNFRPGPIFTNLLLGDEINRASPKTQAALLEAMQEHQVTTDGLSRPTPRPFLVIATQNPIEYEGTYPLPEAQLDRFLLRLSIGYPDAEAEWEMLGRRLERGIPEPEIEAVVDSTEFLAMQAAIEGVYVAESIGRYIVEIVRATRRAAGVEVGSSPRGSLALLLASRARAVLTGRDFVVPEDVKAVAVPALAHRLRLRPDLWVRGEKPDDAIVRCLQEVPTPAGQDMRPV